MRDPDGRVRLCEVLDFGVQRSTRKFKTRPSDRKLEKVDILSRRQVTGKQFPDTSENSLLLSLNRKRNLNVKLHSDNDQEVSMKSDRKCDPGKYQKMTSSLGSDYREKYRKLVGSPLRSNRSMLQIKKSSGISPRGKNPGNSFASKNKIKVLKTFFEGTATTNNLFLSSSGTAAPNNQVSPNLSVYNPLAIQAKLGEPTRRQELEKVAGNFVLDQPGLECRESDQLENFSREKKC